MKIRFESWYKNCAFSEDAENLFEESVLCYKVGAYKASFIMSYLGMQTVLRERLLNSHDKPDNIPENKWQKSMEELSNDNVWDNTVFDLVNRTQPDNPFLITDDIRVQYSYWRTIRNDCAHAKSNIVSHPHIEALWLFVEANLNKFVVNGGIAGLFEKIKRHYDLKYTPPNTDVLPLVNEIPHTMKKLEIPGFFANVDQYFEEELIEFEVFNKESIVFSFWNNIAYSELTVLREAFINFIKSDWNTFRKFIVVFPGKLYEISSDEDFMREFWSSEMWELFQYGDTDGWDILDKLIKSKIIPENEIEEVIRALFKKTKVNPPDFLLDFIKGTTYFEKLRSYLFEGKRMSRPPHGIEFANTNWGRIKFYLTHMELDQEIVSELNAVYLATSYGTFHTKMTQWFETNDTFRKSYKSIVEQNKLKMPSTLEDFSGIEESKPI